MLPFSLGSKYRTDSLLAVNRFVPDGRAVIRDCRKLLVLSACATGSLRLLAVAAEHRHETVRPLARLLGVNA